MSNRLPGGEWDDEGNRRVAVLWLDEQDVFDASVTYLTDGAPPRYRLKLVADGVPLDALSVVRVTHDPLRRAFGFLLHHATFVPVPDGCPAPDLERGDVQWKWVPVEPIVFHYPTSSLSPDELTELREDVEKYIGGTNCQILPVMVPHSPPRPTKTYLAAMRHIERPMTDIPILPKNDGKGDGPHIVEVK